MDIKKNIELSRNGFEKSFLERNYYEKQTKDDKHLHLILDSIDIKEGDKVLDLGTGSGFIAFTAAEKHKKAEIIGIDIVKDTLKRNRIRAKQLNMSNLEFIDYDGLKLPFDDDSIDIVVCRYALHHFPCIEDTFKEIKRVLKSGGRLFISDPTPDDEDRERFVDEFMKIKKDGHIKFYTIDEFRNLADKAGLKFISNKETMIRFPRKNEQKYLEVLSRYSPQIIEKYKIECKGDEIFISEKVLNIMFIKK